MVFLLVIKSVTLNDRVVCVISPNSLAFVTYYVQVTHQEMR